MTNHIFFNQKTNKYTLEPKDASGADNLRKIPPKFSLDDKYASYRREVRKKKFEEQGLL